MSKTFYVAMIGVAHAHHRGLLQDFQGCVRESENMYG